MSVLWSVTILTCSEQITLTRNLFNTIQCFFECDWLSILPIQLLLFQHIYITNKKAILIHIYTINIYFKKPYVSTWTRYLRDRIIYYDNKNKKGENISWLLSRLINNHKYVSRNGSLKSKMLSNSRSGKGIGKAFMNSSLHTRARYTSGFLLIFFILFYRIYDRNVSERNNVPGTISTFSRLSPEPIWISTTFYGTNRKISRRALSSLGNLSRVTSVMAHFGEPENEQILGRHTNVSVTRCSAANED